MRKFISYFFIIVTVFLVVIIIAGGGFGDRTDYSLINQSDPIIFAHRGTVNSNVENSKEAFFKSDSLGFNAIETDISCTKDGKLIIFHDDLCKRLLGIDSRINELNWNDIKTINLIYDGKQTKNTILSLDMFLSQTKPVKSIYLDVKKATKSIADSLIYILEKHEEHKNIIIADGNLLFLTYVKTKKPTLRVALEGFNKGKEWIYYLIPTNYKPDYYSSFLSEVDVDHMSFLKDHNLINNRITYGVDVNNIQKVFDLGIKNIILDYHHSLGEIDSLELDLSQNDFD